MKTVGTFLSLPSLLPSSPTVLARGRWGEGMEAVDEEEEVGEGVEELREEVEEGE